MRKEHSGVIKAWEATIRKTQAAKKCANSIFGTVSVAHADDENEEELENNSTCILELYHAEKILPNGDYYIGQWYNSFPNGHGKYLWTDGCMYVGEWCKGKTMGRGRFSWSSGATYEGEYKSGYMDGTGTYTGTNGAIYRGQWVMNLKHGRGIKNFANGDWYDGEWRRGFHEGDGRYQWTNGNHYASEWRTGMMLGKGTFFWSNGNRYDGCWEDGLPKGSGSFKWHEGRSYVGNWSKEPNEQNVNFCPSSSLIGLGDVEWDPQELYTVHLRDCELCSIEKVSIMPSQKKLAVWNSTKSGPDKPRRMFMDGRASAGLMERRYRMNMLEREECVGDDGGRDFEGGGVSRGYQCECRKPRGDKEKSSAKDTRIMSSCLI